MRRLLQSAYLRNAATLSGGMVIAQAITVASTPLLTRLFRPDEIGTFAIYAMVAGLVATIATGRYELAINLQSSDADARRIVRLCVVLAGATTALVIAALVALAWGSPSGAVPAIYYLLPATILPIAIYNGLNYWFNRARRFDLLAKSRIAAATAQATVAIGLGLARAGAAGLVVAGVAGQAVAAGLLGWNVRKGWQRDGPTTEALAEKARRYREFPMFSVPAFFTRHLTEHLPALLLAVTYDAAIVGYFALTQRIVRLPLIMIGTAIGGVFRREASEARGRDGSFAGVYRRTLVGLALASAVPFLAMGLFAPGLIELVLGSDWRTSGQFVQAMTLAYFLQFLALPLGVSFTVAERQRREWSSHMVTLALSAGGFALGHRIFGQPLGAVATMAGGFAAGYAVSIVLSARVARRGAPHDDGGTGRPDGASRWRRPALAAGLVAVAGYGWLAVAAYRANRPDSAERPSGVWLVGPTSVGLEAEADRRTEVALELLEDTSVDHAQRLDGFRRALFDAEHLLVRAARAQPNRATALARLAAVRHELDPGTAEAAGELVELAGALAPGVPAVQRQLGELLLDMGHRHEAHEALRRTLKLDDREAKRVIDMLRRRQLPARRILEALESAPGALEALRPAFWADGDERTYLAALDRRLDALGPESPASLLAAYGGTCLRSGDPVRLLARLDSTGPLPASSVEAERLRWRSRALVRLRRFSEAADDARAARGHDPSSAGLAELAGQVFLAAGEPDAAIGSFRDALALVARGNGSPEVRARLYDGVGRAEEARGHPARAYDAYRMAVQLNPELTHAGTRLRGMQQASGVHSSVGASGR